MAEEGPMMHPEEGEITGETETAVSDPQTDDSMTMDQPAWQTLSLTNVQSNETFTLADFAGKTIFVEPMATWCTNCRQQLTNVQEARAQLDDETAVFVALSVETTISHADLQQYTADTGFNWVFAVATPELLQELVATFGQTITNPPSTPHFIIRPDGSYTDLVTGIESAEAIVAQMKTAMQN